MTRAWPLRYRLLVAVLGLSAACLTVFAVAGVVLLDRSLLSRVDSQLAEMSATVRVQPLRPDLPPPPPDVLELPTQYRIVFYAAPGTPPLDEVPADLSDGPMIPADAIAEVPDAPFTVSDRTGRAAWRVLVVRLPDGGSAAVSMSLESNQSTVRQLLLIEMAVGGLVLLLLGIVAFAVVRLELRPLTRIERTAEVIAAGEIDRRVADADPRTEAGRLGGALNIMLERLARARRERERSEQRLRHFVADASHELRTPLTSIRGFAELYHHGRAARDPSVERLMRRIEAESERMGVLVDDLLLLARLDQEPSLELSTVDLHVLAGDVVHAAHARDRNRPIRLVVSEIEVRVTGDENRLHQVIANLVSNAMTYTTPSIPIRVVVGHQMVDGMPENPCDRIRAAMVEVQDDGPGIDPEHLPHVFDRFYRADPNRSRDKGGTGLGLAIASALVEAHGGRIDVMSNPKTGTSFRVFLPPQGSESR